MIWQTLWCGHIGVGKRCGMIEILVSPSGKIVMQAFGLLKQAMLPAGSIYKSSEHSSQHITGP